MFSAQRDAATENSDEVLNLNLGLDALNGAAPSLKALDHLTAENCGFRRVLAQFVRCGEEVMHEELISLDFLSRERHLLGPSLHCFVAQIGELQALICRRAVSLCLVRSHFGQLTSVMLWGPGDLMQGGLNGASWTAWPSQLIGVSLLLLLAHHLLALDHQEQLCQRRCPS